MSNHTKQTITPSLLAERKGRGDAINLIDVRTPVEYRELHVAYARNVPLDQLNPSDVLASHDRDEPLYVICHSGSRAAQACDAIVRWGYSNVINVEGGTLAWDAAGLPVVRGKKGVSLERQVRIAAGLIVVASVVLSQTLSEHFVWLAAFVGAGLAFAGITDTCGMGMLLARMPWNRVEETSSPTCNLEP